MKAVGRVMTGGDPMRTVVERQRGYLADAHDVPVFEEPVAPAETHYALFEALNWAVSLDDRFVNDWPGGRFWEWPVQVDHGGGVRGLRYVRNCVHHNWAVAFLWPTSGDASFVRSDVHRLNWVSDLEAERPDPKGREAYQQHLAGEGVMTSLLSIQATFVQGLMRLVEGGRATGRPSDRSAG